MPATKTGIALVNASGVVVEFLSYEGTFTAVGGAANGMTSTDIGVSQAGNEPIGASIFRRSDGSWQESSASEPATFGGCNEPRAGPDRGQGPRQVR